FGMALTGLMFIASPSAVLGITFPMIGGIAAASKKVGAMVGAVYAANTCGCVLGAIMVGVLVQNSLTSFKCFQATIVLTALLGSLAFVRSLWPDKALAVVSGLVPIVPALLFACFVEDPLVQVMATMKEPKVLASGEDATGVVMVLAHPDYKELRTGSAAVS